MTVIDTHVHYIDEDAPEFVEMLLRRMDENGVDQAVLFGVQGDPICSDAGVWHAVNAHPDRFIPFACSLRCELERDAEVFLSYLSRPPWRGVGEVYADLGGCVGVDYGMRDGTMAYFPHYCPEDRHRNPVYARVFAHCGERGLPVMVHCQSVETMEGLLPLFPRTNFIWAHTDHMLVEDDTVPMLDRFPNLYCEVGIQFRLEWEKLLCGKLGPDDAWLPRRFKAWQEAAAKHPTRVLWGSDVYCWTDLSDPEIYRSTRELFALFSEPLPAEAKAGVAGANLLALLPR